MTDGHCHHCKCDLDVCSFCERGDCPVATCYRCLRTELLPQAPDVAAAEPAASD